jgi:hypothetical protein
MPIFSPKRRLVVVKRNILISAAVMVLLFLVFRDVKAIPSFARQTGFSCSTCHEIFPKLNAFGRVFKLNAYTLTGIKTIDSSGKSGPELKLTSFMPMSAMVQTSYSSIGKAEPRKRRSQSEFPQQMSFFIAGEITPNLGTFIQITYDDQSAQLGWDNTDIRFATKTNLGSKEFILGLTLNNNPTVQDVWNSTPAWGFPFFSSAVAPVPSTATLIEGGLAQQVAGLGVYGFYNNFVYGEFSLYISTPQGGPYPADYSSAFTIKGVSPYWRVALQHNWSAHYLEIGAYGLFSEIYPAGISGSADKYTDIALDAQYEWSHGDFDVSAFGTWIHESQKLDATYSAGDSYNLSNTIQTFKITGRLSYEKTYAFALGYFSTTGSRDPLLYVPDPVTGSIDHKPNSDGLIFESSFIPWQNALFSLQYTLYNHFNGLGKDYDGFGRDAANNNTVYLIFWIAF